MPAAAAAMESHRSAEVVAIRPNRDPKTDFHIQLKADVEDKNSRCTTHEEEEEQQQQRMEALFIMHFIYSSEKFRNCMISLLERHDDGAGTRRRRRGEGGRWAAGIITINL